MNETKLISILDDKIFHIKKEINAWSNKIEPYDYNQKNK